MPTKARYHAKRRNTVAKKKSRIVKKASAMPSQGTFVVKGTSPDKKTKTFRFSVLSPAQQVRERNRAYQFFSID
jgi:hypothetical protein